MERREKEESIWYEVSAAASLSSPEQPALFEQAIFLVRTTHAPRGDMVREACRIANSYLPRRRRSRRKADGLSLLAGFWAGALLIGTIWALTALVL
ncbi:MAG: hypothetical protein ACLSDM_04225 [Butyricicoccus sp.]